jgi:hypothetical protein
MESIRDTPLEAYDAKKRYGKRRERNSGDLCVVPVKRKLSPLDSSGRQQWP